MGFVIALTVDREIVAIQEDTMQIRPRQPDESIDEYNAGVSATLTWNHDVWRLLRLTDDLPPKFDQQAVRRIYNLIFHRPHEEQFVLMNALEASKADNIDDLMAELESVLSELADDSSEFTDEGTRD